MKRQKTLALIKQNLLRLHPATFDPDDFLARWFPPAVSNLFLAHAVEMRCKAMTVHRISGPPLQCFATAGLHATKNPDLVPCLGFILTNEPEWGGWHWWLHARCVNPARTERWETDPSASLGEGFVGVPYCRELYLSLPHDDDFNSADTIPPLFRRSVMEFPTDEPSRAWATDSTTYTN